MAKETNGPGHRWPLWPWLVLTVAGVVVTAVAAIVGTVAGSNTTEDSPPATPRVTITATEFQTKTITQTVTATPPPGQSCQAMPRIQCFCFALRPEAFPECLRWPQTSWI